MFAVLVITATVLTGTPALAVSAGSVQSPATAQSGNESTAPATPLQQSTRQQSTPVVSVPNTSSYLSIPANDVETNQFATASLDVTGSVAVESNELRDQFLERSVFRAFNDAESTREQTMILRQSANEIESRTAALRSLQARTLQEYNRGTISTTMFLRRIAIIDSRARVLTITVDRILQEVGQSPNYSLPNTLRTRFQNLRSRPTLLQGPNRARIGTAIAGAQSSAQMYVETSDTGIVIARAAGNGYTREAFLGSQYQVGGVDQFGQGELAPISAAYDQARNLYPWTIENDITNPSATGFGNTSVYRITIDHTQGTLVSYLDGTTTQVFRELQEKRLSALPTETALNETANLTLVVNRTHDTGPMEVHVREFNSTQTVDAEISVGNQIVGRTGDDGRLWTVEPRGAVTVSAVAPSGNRIQLWIPA
jgi:hypothetical protein